MNKDNFIKISMRGRVAFSISCLENALKHFSYNIDEWKYLLEKLWSYTNIEYLDDWVLYYCGSSSRFHIGI